MTTLKTLIQWIGNGLFMLLVFLFVADPTNTILGLKSHVFALLLLYNLVFFKADWSKIIYILIPVACVLVSFIFATMQGSHVDMGALKDLLLSFAPLVLLLWAGHYDMVRLSVAPVVVAAIVVLALFWTVCFMPELEGLIYNYMGKHNDTIMMSNRVILGFRIFCMYPKSTVAFLPVFGYLVYKSMTRSKNRIWNILLMLVLLHMFVISGTRSSVLFPVLLVGVMVFVYCRNGRYLRYVVYPAVAAFVVLFFAVLAMLLLETDEPSNLVKYAHLTSYKELFETNPQYLLMGQGPCTEFYSMGFRKMTLQTEWTYVELIRNYGIMCLPILYVILLPIYRLFRQAQRHDSALAIALAYIVYLIIAGTNPLLFSSTGMLVLLSAYSYTDRLKCSKE